MANNFADDARIIEFWRFENNLTAGKAGNNLTGQGSPTYNSAAPLEGAYSLNLEKDDLQYVHRSDNVLSAGFPLKLGDTVKKISCAFWIVPQTLPASLYPLVSKWYSLSNARTFMVDLISTGELRVSIGYNSGASGESWSVGNSIVAGRKYHVGVAVDGIAKTATVRVWDDYNSTATTYTNTFTNEMNIEDAIFCVGFFQAGSYYYDGLLDELVVANNLLSAAEFDQIRQGTFGAVSSYIKTIDSLALASVKTVNGLAIASMKTWGGLA